MRLPADAKPNVLVVAGHDPSGGAGIHADIEAIAACGAHAATVVTALTCQDTQNVHGVLATDTAFVIDCLDALAADMPFAAIKTGVLASEAQVEAVAAFAARFVDVPLVVDPVLVAAGGGRLAEDRVGQAIRDRLLPLATIATPNAREARALCDGQHDLTRCAQRLVSPGGHLLITGGDEDEGTRVHNRLFDANGLVAAYDWPRLDGSFHGSGCTLASTLAGLLAHGQALTDAVADAQARTWQALSGAYRVGRGQSIPNRLAGRTS